MPFITCSNFSCHSTAPYKIDRHRGNQAEYLYLCSRCIEGCIKFNGCTYNEMVKIVSADILMKRLYDFVMQDKVMEWDPNTMLLRYTEFYSKALNEFATDSSAEAVALEASLAAQYMQKCIEVFKEEMAR